LVEARRGDKAARRRVVGAHVRESTEIVLRLAPVWMRRLDAIQEANAVLVRLVNDPKGGLTKASFEGAIADHLAEIARRFPRPST
jgi:hypothetical protein